MQFSNKYGTSFASGHYPFIAHIRSSASICDMDTPGTSSQGVGGSSSSQPSKQPMMYICGGEKKFIEFPIYIYEIPIIQFSV